MAGHLVQGVILAALLCHCSAVRVSLVNSRESAQAEAAVVVPEMFVLTHLTPVHIADIFSRVCGLPPLLSETEVALPARNIFSAAPTPVLVDVSDRLDAFLLDGVTDKTLMRTVSSELTADVQFAEVASALTENKLQHIALADAQVDDLQLLEQAQHTDGVVIVKLESLGLIRRSQGIFSFEYAQRQARLREALSALARIRPVLLLEHEQDVQAITQTVSRSRRLSSSNSTNSSSSSNSTLTEEEIALYQITLWTAVILVLAAFAAVCSLCYMKVEPDSLLYAKFQSGRTHKHD